MSATSIQNIGNNPPMIRWAKPTPCELARWVNACLNNGENLTFSTHAARDRLRQRGFQPSDVAAILREGYAYRTDAGAEPGEWKVNISKTMACGRDAAAVCLVSRNVQKVIVLTVMWVDRSYLKA